MCAKHSRAVARMLGLDRLRPPPATRPTIAAGLPRTVHLVGSGEVAVRCAQQLRSSIGHDGSWGAGENKMKSGSSMFEGGDMSRFGLVRGAVNMDRGVLFGVHLARPCLQARRSVRRTLHGIGRGRRGTARTCCDFSAPDTHVHLRKGWRRSGEGIFEHWRGHATPMTVRSTGATGQVQQ